MTQAKQSGKKILVATGVFHPEAGGPPTYLYHLLPEIQAQGHAVHVLVYGEPYDHDYGYPVTRISRRGGLFRRTLRYWRAMFALTQWSDAMFVMGYVLPLPLIRLFYRKRIVTKVVSDFSWEFADRRGLTRLDVNAFQTAQLPPLLAVLRRFYRFAVRRSDAVIVPSTHVAQLVRGWGVPKSDIYTIYNAVPDTDLYQVERAELRRELRRELGSREDVPLLVSIARLTPVKGVDVALKALAYLPQCHFVVVGDGPQEAELKTLAPPERVSFVGRKSHDDVMRYMRAADIFVLSSRTEGLSHVLLEALAVGTPAVATRVGGNPEVLTDEVNGLLVPPENPEALAHAIQRMLDDPALAARLAEAGRERSADFSWSHTVMKTLELLIP